MAEEVERYRKPTRVLYWVHTTAFMLLFLTGLVLFIPQLGFLAGDSWTRLIHRIAAVIFAVAPLNLYTYELEGNTKGSKRGLHLGYRRLRLVKGSA